MLHRPRRDLGECMDPDRIFYGEGRGEGGICLHLPLKGYVAGSCTAEDYELMISVANYLIEYLLYKRAIKGPQLWDYDTDKASEVYSVCGDNPTSSGVILFDKNYVGGPKLQVFLDKTFGANEVAVKWKNNLVGDEVLLGDFEEYMKQALRNGEFAQSEEE